MPPAPTTAPLRPMYTKLLLLGLVGAIAASGVAVAIALLLARPDIPAELHVATPDAAASRLMAVEDLRAEEEGRWTADPGTWRLSVTWTPVEGATGYVISRDGRRLDETGGTEFIDDAVTPERRYRYEVVAVGADRNRSKPARVRIRTDPLPKSVARVQGRWLIKLKVESSSIFTSGGRIVVTFTPDCRQGPCAVGWGFERLGNTGTARNDGAHYEGTGFGGFLTVDCHGDVVSSTVTLEFRVVKAHTVREAWRATEISGTLTESVPSVSNCLSANNRWSFTGTAQG